MIDLNVTKAAANYLIKQLQSKGDGKALKMAATIKTAVSKMKPGSKLQISLTTSDYNLLCNPCKKALKRNPGKPTKTPYGNLEIIKLNGYIEKGKDRFIYDTWVIKNAAGKYFSIDKKFPYGLAKKKFVSQIVKDWAAGKPHKKLVPQNWISAKYTAFNPLSPLTARLRKQGVLKSTEWIGGNEFISHKPKKNKYRELEKLGQLRLFNPGKPNTKYTQLSTGFERPLKYWVEFYGTKTALKRAIDNNLLIPVKKKKIVKNPPSKQIVNDTITGKRFYDIPKGLKWYSLGNNKHQTILKHYSGNPVSPETGFLKITLEKKSDGDFNIMTEHLANNGTVLERWNTNSYKDKVTEVKKDMPFLIYEKLKLKEGGKVFYSENSSEFLDPKEKPRKKTSSKKPTKKNMVSSLSSHDQWVKKLIKQSKASGIFGTPGYKIKDFDRLVNSGSKTEIEKYLAMIERLGKRPNQAGKKVRATVYKTSDGKFQAPRNSRRKPILKPGTQINPRGKK